MRIKPDFMKYLKIFLAVLCLATPFIAEAQPIPISPAGILLKAFYDSQNVEKLWLPGNEVEWTTGESVRASKKPTTHCSAFVAAILMKQAIYILRPPEHGLKDLANAQYDYLLSEKAGQNAWIQLPHDYDLVQKKANDGYFVVAVVHNDKKNKPGHIAFIYPTACESKKILNSGPLLIQAGKINKAGIDLREGFNNHYSDFSNNAILFFYFDRPFG